MGDFLQINFSSPASFGVYFGLFFASFISIVSVANPLSGMPIFTSLTENNTQKEQINIAKKAALYMFVILALFLFAGTYIKSFFGISLASIRVAGGLIILRSAWTMLMPGADTKMTDEDKESVKTKNDVSFSPLAMPLLAGPGSISVVIGLASESEGVLDFFIILVAILASALVSYVIFRLGPYSSQYIGSSGMNTITRLMGFIVMAIATQFILSGIQEFFMIEVT